MTRRKTDKMLSRKEGGVGYVIFNNPERHNAMSLDMWEAAGESSTTSATTTTSRGGGHRRRRQGLRLGRRHLALREGALQRGSGRRTTTRPSSKSYAAFHEFPKPTIAMIRGYCIGGGMGLAICCDLRIATEKLEFAVPAAKLGLGYGYPG